MADSMDALTIQWQIAMDRLKHHESLTVTGIGLFLAAAGYAIHEVLAKINKPTEGDYWAVVFVLTMLCIAQLHGVDRVNDSAVGVIELEMASEGRLTYLSNVTRRITWTVSFGFIAIFVAPAVSVLSIMFAYRNLVSDLWSPFIAMAISGLIFLGFAIMIFRQQGTIKAGLKYLGMRR